MTKLDLANRYGRVMGQNGFGSKRVILIRVETGLGQNRFELERVRVGTGLGESGFRVGSVKKMFFFKVIDKNSEHEEKIKSVIEKNNELKSSCESLHVEKSPLVLKKSVLLSQLRVIMVNMQKLVDQNTLLEDSLSTANTELKDLREKSKGLEEVCELLL
ncbi:hypothetical protein Hanom_Chr12g01115461 [Helianthus anomalus]